MHPQDTSCELFSCGLDFQEAESHLHYNYLRIRHVYKDETTYLFQITQTLFHIFISTMQLYRGIH